MKNYLILLCIAFSLNVIGQIPNTLSPADKVYGLSKFWQEVNYNFVYLNKIDKELWNEAYRELIITVQNSENDYEYYRQLSKFCALLKDGHTTIHFPENIDFMNTMFGDYRLFIENIDNKAVIVRTNLSKKNEIPVGTEIIEVNGKPIQKYIDEDVAPYISTSTDHVRKDLAVSNLLKGLEGDSYLVKIRKPNGVVVDLALTHSFTAEEEVFPSFETNRDIFEFKWLKDKIAYVALNSFENEKVVADFIDKLPELYKAKSLIIDLRKNGGGNSLYAAKIYEYLTNDKMIYGAKSITRQHIATYKAWGSFFSEKDTLSDNPNFGMTKEEITKFYLNSRDNYFYAFPNEGDSISLNAKRLVIPTIILTGHKTASAAEDFLIFTEKQEHIRRVGEKTYGSTGQPYIFNLPGGGSAWVCTKKATYPDGKEFVGYGIIPEIEVKQTLDEFLNYNDVVLEKAIELLKE